MNIKTVNFPQEIHRYDIKINILGLLCKIRKKKARSNKLSINDILRATFIYRNMFNSVLEIMVFLVH